MPYKRLASRVVNTLAATSQPCETSMMLNRLTKILNTYSIQPRFNESRYQMAIRHPIENSVATVTADFSEDFTATFV
jgi:hypothetical protein